jgi:putative membrane protein
VHRHDSGSSGISTDLILAVPFVAAVIAYVAAASSDRRRGRKWPSYRTAFWVAGVTVAAMGFVGPLASAAHDGFTAHMGAHLLVGMVAPLLLALAAPMTLALRTMSVVPAKRVTRLLRGPLGRVLANPVFAALLNIGSMWVLYRTPLYELMQQVVLVHLLVTLHFLFAGYLYIVAIVPVDPSPHKAGFVCRAGVLVVSLAAHGVLAKLLYAEPPSGVSTADAHAGAQLMFYGGDAVDLVLMVLLCAEWYRVSGRRRQTTTALLPPGRAKGRAS